MACAHPFIHGNRSRLYGGYVNVSPETLIPCGWCINCRKDKQNYIIDRAEYEYKTRLTGSFVTFTYDQLHLFDECLVKDGFDHPIIDPDGTYRATLNYDHVTHFVDSIRHYVKAHPELQGVLCQPDFSYMYVGEYGDCFKRPHYHILFFGLDFAYCEKLFYKFWHKGMIDVLPILDGGIAYVTKYMDKQVFGMLAKVQYDQKLLERPRLRMSVGFGKGLLLDNLNDIVENDFTYACGRGLRRPISSYWKSLITGNDPRRDVTKTRRFVAKSLDRINQYRREVNLPPFKYDKTSNSSLLRAQTFASLFSIQKAKIREYNLTLMARNNGYPCVNPDEIMFSKYGRPTYIHDKIKDLSDDVKHWLAADFVERLIYDDDVPF